MPESRSERNHERYHISPWQYPYQNSLYLQVEAYSIATHKRVNPWVPIVCFNHKGIFRYRGECQWSRRMGMGWKTDREDRRMTWRQKMNRLNRLWDKWRREKVGAQGSTDPLQPG
jgi:hypothetical protein